MPVKGKNIYAALFFLTSVQTCACGMKRAIKITVSAIAILLITGAIALLFLTNSLQKRFAKKYTPNTPNIIIPHNAIALQRGNMLASAVCAPCHGADFSGMKIFDNPRAGIIYSKNITPGGATKKFSDANWINAIKFGIKDDNTATFIMPSHDDYNTMSDYDLGCIIAYLKTIKPVDKNLPSNPDALTLYGKVYVQTGRLGAGIFSAEAINMSDNSPRTSPAFKETPAYGGYLVTISDCRYCHGPALNGGTDTGNTAPFAPNITPGGNAGRWNKEQFIKTVRTGLTPEGKHLDPVFMPWPYIAVYNDTALEAIYAYLHSQPALKDSKK